MLPCDGIQTSQALSRAPHRTSILSDDFRDVGVGFSRGTPNDGRASGAVYTTDFGLRVG